MINIFLSTNESSAFSSGGASTLSSPTSGNRISDSDITQSAITINQRVQDENEDAAIVDLANDTGQTRNATSSAGVNSISASNAQSAVDIARGAVESADRILTEINDLTSNLQNEATPSNRATIEQEIGDLISELDNVVSSAEFQGQAVFGQSNSFQVGDSAVTLSFADISSDALGISTPSFLIEESSEERSNQSGGAEEIPKQQGGDEVVQGADAGTDDELGGGGIELGEDAQVIEEVETEPEPREITPGDSGVDTTTFQAQIAAAQTSLAAVADSVDSAQSAVTNAAQASGLATSSTEETNNPSQAIQTLGQEPEQLAATIANAIDEQFVQSTVATVSSATVDTLLTGESDRQQISSLGAESGDGNTISILERVEAAAEQDETNSEEQREEPSLLDQLIDEQEENSTERDSASEISAIA